MGLLLNCRVAACVLRLSLTKRSASALNVPLDLRRLPGEAPLMLVAITEEMYIFLMFVISRPLQLKEDFLGT